eukprot:5549493-Prymnesium_polylepis.2
MTFPVDGHQSLIIARARRAPSVALSVVPLSQLVLCGLVCAARYLMPRYLITPRRPNPENDTPRTLAQWTAARSHGHTARSNGHLPK